MKVLVLKCEEFKDHLLILLHKYSNTIYSFGSNFQTAIFMSLSWCH